MKKKLVILILTSLVFPVGVLAQVQAPNIPLMIGLERIINTLFWVLIVVAVIILVWGGVLFVTSAGDTEKASQARTLIFYAVIGIIVAIFARGIVEFIRSQIGPGPLL